MGPHEGDLRLSHIAGQCILHIHMVLSGGTVVLWCRLLPKKNTTRSKRLRPGGPGRPPPVKD